MRAKKYNAERSMSSGRAGQKKGLGLKGNCEGCGVDVTLNDIYSNYHWDYCGGRENAMCYECYHKYIDSAEGVVEARNSPQSLKKDAKDYLAIYEAFRFKDSKVAREALRNYKRIKFVLERLK